MSKTIALTGTTGAMGGEVLLSLLRSDKNFNVRCIIFDKERSIPSFVKKTLKKYKKRVKNILFFALFFQKKLSFFMFLFAILYAPLQHI